jgi:hypothetical protein
VQYRQNRSGTNLILNRSRLPRELAF